MQSFAHFKIFFKAPQLRVQRELLIRSVSSSKVQILTSILVLLFKPPTDRVESVNILVLLLLGSGILRWRFSSKALSQGKSAFFQLYAIHCLHIGIWAGITYQYIGYGNETTGYGTVFGYLMAFGILSASVQSIGLSQLMFYTSALMLAIPSIFSKMPTAEVSYSLVYYFLFAFYLDQQRRSQSIVWYQNLEAADELRNIIECFPGAISLVRKGRYAFANSEVATIVGVPIVDIIGTEVGGRNPDGLIPKMVRDLNASPQKMLTKETVFGANGKLRDYLVFGRRLENGDVVIISLDVTEKKSLERELEVQKAKFQNSSKMAALGEMSAGLSHEINNPLAIITGNAYRMKQIIGRKPIDEAAINKLADSITKVSERIAKIVLNLKNFARDGEQDPMSLASLLEIIQETLVFCESRFGNHGVQFRKKGFERDVMVKCRSVQISQVILNLLNNAHDACVLTENPWIELELITDENFVFIKVRDSGPGVNPDVREKIMSPFFTTKEVGKGTGLGLSISRGLIEDHGGKLYFDFSEPHTTVVAVLPKFREEALKAS